VERPVAQRRPDRLAKQDAQPIPDRPHELRAFLCVRDEALRLPYTIEHHRALGIERFFIADNGSTDGTTEYLLRQPDVHVFRVEGSFAKAGCGISWINSLLDAFGDGHWCLTIDADELFVYPASEWTSLRSFTDYLDAKGARVVFALLLDMFSAGPIRAAEARPGQPFLEVCPFFDAGPFHTRAVAAFPGHQIYGGPRARAFWDGRNRGDHPPTVSKLPLVRWTRGLRYLMATHGMEAPLPVADVRGALLHFKFFSDFHDRAVREAARGEHALGAREYHYYAEVLRERPELSLHHAGSLRYEDTIQLDKLGLLMSSEPYRNFANDRV